MNDQEFVHKIKYDMYVISQMPRNLAFLEKEFVKLSRAIVGVNDRKYRMLHPEDKRRLENKFGLSGNHIGTEATLTPKDEKSAKLDGVILLPIETIKRIVIPNTVPSTF